MASGQLLEPTLPSSSPAFATPVDTTRRIETLQPSILPIVLPSATLRPVAFRIFTKKHNLNLTSSALEALASFVGRTCGSGWREGGSAEKVLDEAAKLWKKNGGGVVVADNGQLLKNILQQLSSHSGAQAERAASALSERPDAVKATEPSREQIQQVRERQPAALGGSRDAEHMESTDLRAWMKVVNATDQPRLHYNSERRHFEPIAGKASSLPEPAKKIAVFRQRYSLIQQRLLRNESFQISAVRSREKSSHRSPPSGEENYKLTLVANLLGRGGSQHLLFGLLARSPSGFLTLNDPTGSVVLDLQYARETLQDAAWFTPGMMIIVDGQYSDSDAKVGVNLSAKSGIGGTIGGSFLVSGLIGPPSERRNFTLGISGAHGQHLPSVGAGFGWVDFLGVGSQRATGDSMKAIEDRIFDERQESGLRNEQGKIVILGEVNLDVAKTIRALRKILGLYANSAGNTPTAVVLIGNFVSHAAMAGRATGDTVDYKEYFDTLASTLSDYPNMLQKTTFVFVPGDNDPWASSYFAGASTMVPRPRIPEIFTSRIKRAFATANANEERFPGSTAAGEASWATNPTRLTFCGPCQEIVIFRDDMLGRIRRNAISLASANEYLHGDTATPLDTPASPRSDMESTDPSSIETPQIKENRSQRPDSATAEIKTARKLIKTIIDQGHLSPFPLSQRPVQWEHSSALSLYPLPTALILMDTEAPRFAIGLDGCHVMNPGPLTPPNKKGMAQWIEYNLKTRRGNLRETHI